jgi:oligopeptide transport system ATP-binding protein
MEEKKSVLIHIENLTKEFAVEGGFWRRSKQKVHAVSDVSFQIQIGETFGLVGESGCGKSTLGRCLLRLIEPTQGRVLYDGRNIFELKPRELRELRRKIQIIFQDPYSSLNPRMTVGQILSEPLEIHQLHCGKSARKNRIHELMDRCGLREEFVSRYPHEFSGGQRQRICIARALAVEPEFIVCDEPVSALDVSIQAQIINLLKDLQRDFGLTYLFIAHDLNVVETISDRIAVMYLGQIVELAEKNQLFDSPKHPYTQSLLSAIPVASLSSKTKRKLLSGDAPSPLQPPEGCHFHPRCPIAQNKCQSEAPELLEESENGLVRCHYSGGPR